MYADSVTRSMESAIKETERRRNIQNDYNIKNGITPKTVIKDVRDVIEITSKEDIEKKTTPAIKLSQAEKRALIDRMTKEMKEAAKLLEFEHAAFLRDKIEKLKNEKW